MKDIFEKDLNHKVHTCQSLTLYTNITLTILTCVIDFILIKNIFVREYCIIWGFSANTINAWLFFAWLYAIRLRLNNTWATCEQINAWMKLIKCNSYFMKNLMFKHITHYTVHIRQKSLVSWSFSTEKILVERSKLIE